MGMLPSRQNGLDRVLDVADLERLASDQVEAHGADPEFSPKHLDKLAHFDFSSIIISVDGIKYFEAAIHQTLPA